MVIIREGCVYCTRIFNYVVDVDVDVVHDLSIAVNQHLGTINYYKLYQLNSQKQRNTSKNPTQISFIGATGGRTNVRLAHILINDYNANAGIMLLRIRERIQV